LKIKDKTVVVYLKRISAARMGGTKFMRHFDSPFFVFAAVLIVQWLAAYVGDIVRTKVRPLKGDERLDFDIIRTAALTLLGLIIGFSFAMAVSRYDQRMNLEQAEANAIGTEYLRTDLLPADTASRVRELLRAYCDERVSYYMARDEQRVGEIDIDTRKLQSELWAAVAHVATAQPTPIIALTVAGMNEVLNSQVATQAAWWNRIPFTAWALMGLIAVACNLLMGYGEHRTTAFLAVLPLIISISLFLIADIDSPRTGIILVQPLNLMSQCLSMKPG
jgi:hypothetical protein